MTIAIPMTTKAHQKSRDNLSNKASYMTKGYIIHYLSAPPATSIWGVKKERRQMNDTEYSKQLAVANVEELLDQGLYNEPVVGGSTKAQPLDPYKGGACDSKAFHLPGMWEVRSNEQLYNTAQDILDDSRLWVDIDRCLVDFSPEIMSLKWDFNPAILQEQLKEIPNEQKRAQGLIAGEKVCGFMAFTDCIFESLSKADSKAILAEVSTKTIEQVGSCWHLTIETKYKTSKVDVQHGQYILWDPMLPYRIIPNNVKKVALGMPCGFRRVVRTAKGQAPEHQYGRSSYTDTSKLWFQNISSLWQSHGTSRIQTDAIIEDARGKRDAGISELDDRLHSFSNDTAPTLLPELQYIQGYTGGGLDLKYVNTKPELSENMVSTDNAPVRLEQAITSWPDVQIDLDGDSGKLNKEIYTTSLDETIDVTPYLLMPLSSSECTFLRVERSRNIFMKKQGVRGIIFTENDGGKRASLLLGATSYGNEEWDAEDNKAKAVVDSTNHPRVIKKRRPEASS